MGIPGAIVLYYHLMIPSFLITFREVIEAALIVATILGILTKLNQKRQIKTVWLATITAGAVSIGFLALGSVLGVTLQRFYTAEIEGALMMLSALFITWAVFSLHTYFGKYKTRLLVRLKDTVEKNQQRGLFLLTFTAVFREGAEIVLFLSTIYLSSEPAPIVGGFGLGLVAGLLVSFAFFSATLRLPVYWAFRTSSILLILFAAGLLARGVHEIAEIGMLPHLARVTPNMDLLQLSVYLTYIFLMHRQVFVRSR